MIVFSPVLKTNSIFNVRTYDKNKMKTKKQIRNYVTNKDIAHKIWSDPQILISSLDQKIKLSLTDMLYIYIYTH